jgi:hypothetical protein
MKEGITLGRSTAFITAVMCEMLRAYTVKSTESAWSTFNRNTVMHYACFISFACTILLTIIPGIKTIFKLDTPDWFFYFLSAGFAFLCMVNDEVFKFLYRIKIAERKEIYAEQERKVFEERRLQALADTVLSSHDANKKGELHDKLFAMEAKLNKLIELQKFNALSGNGGSGIGSDEQVGHKNSRVSFTGNADKLRAASRMSL